MNFDLQPEFQFNLNQKVSKPYENLIQRHLALDLGISCTYNRDFYAINWPNLCTEKFLIQNCSLDVTRRDNSLSRLPCHGPGFTN